MTLNCCTFKFSRNFVLYSCHVWEATTTKPMKIDPHWQRGNCCALKVAYFSTMYILRWYCWEILSGGPIKWVAFYIPTKTSVFHFGRSVCSCCQTAYCWTSCFLCCWRACLERSSCRRHLFISTFSVHFPKTFKTASLFALVPWPSLLN